MDKPTPKDRVEHVLEAIELIRTFTANTDEATFLSDTQLQSAVQFQFLIIGEAIRHIDGYILEKYPYPWHIPRSFRNFIIHEYHGISMDRIFFASQDLNTLEAAVRRLLENEF